jgi:LysM repeat protein
VVRYDPGPSRLERDFARRRVVLEPSGIDVVVRKGDTVNDIAARHGTSPQAVLEANAMSPEDPTIYPGQILFVPKTARGGRADFR